MRRTSFSLLLTTVQTIQTIGERFDLADAAVLTGALRHAAKPDRVGDVERHPERCKPGRLARSSTPWGVRLAARDDAALAAVVANLTQRFGIAPSATEAADVAVRDLATCIEAGFYDESADGRADVLVGRRRPVAGGRERYERARGALTASEPRPLPYLARKRRNR